MTIEDINSHRPTAVKCKNSYRATIFQLACITTMTYILATHNNIKSFGSRYDVVPVNGENTVLPAFIIECAGDTSIMLGDCATGDKYLATVMHGEEFGIGIRYRLTHPITHETDINDICEELYPLILALIHYDKIKELKDMRDQDNHIQTELTEQDLKKIMPEDYLDDKPAEVIELR